MTPQRLTVTTLSALCLAGTSAFAGTDAKAPAAVEPAKEKSVYDKIWSIAKPYKNEDNPVIQEFAFSGRAQFEYFNTDADQGSAEDWEVRRLRFGAKMKLFEKWVLHGEADFDAQDPNPFYNKLTDAYLQYQHSDLLNVTLGKHAVKFGLDGSTSSKELITIDRSNLANNLWFTEEYAPGVSIAGDKGNWSYFLGWFTSDGNPEFGEFDAGTFVLTRLGYNFKEALKADNAQLWVDYVYQTPDENNDATRPFEHIGSVNFLYEKGKFGFGSDVKAGSGYGDQGDVFGVQIMPSYYLTDKVQAVFRYTYLNGDDNSVRFARYENRIMDKATGDQYQEFYAGINWFLYGHKLKFQTGLQYAMMDDSANDGGEYDGWQVVTGIRISW